MNDETTRTTTTAATGDDDDDDDEKEQSTGLENCIKCKTKNCDRFSFRQMALKALARAVWRPTQTFF